MTESFEKVKGVSLAIKEGLLNSSDNISIEDVREVLSKKVATHRSEIKEKLTELGAPSVTKLDKSKYSYMLNFLNSLD